MDLRLLAAEPSDAEREAIDAVVGSAESGGDRVARADRTSRHLLLPALRAAQRRIGWVSEGALGYASRRLGVPPADAYGVATFYALLALEERPAEALHVCTDLSCRLAGVRDAPPGAHASPCLGLCERAPASLRTIAGEQPREIPLPEASPPLPQTGEPGPLGQQGLRLLRRIAAGVDPESLDAYRAHGGYAALRRALELGPAGVLREVSDSRLLGRGGAAFPTGAKWEAVARQPARPHYLVCNADESEPGTFKDRVLMEGDPFALVEAMTIAAYATGCDHGFVYVRAEYPLAHERLENAFARARDRGLLGGDVMGAGFAFDLELRIGAGAYVCGEETALFQSIEGYRGEPRNKPPFPVEVGLFGKPTVVNNVETLFNVLDVVSDTGTVYAQTGTEGSTGTRLFCLSGRVERPGLYEVPFGTLLSDLLERAGARLPQAVLLGGAAGSFLRPDQLDLPLTFEDARAAGATLGSGVVIVYDESADLADAVLRIAEFFRDESCGQCVPCRVGTIRQEEALRRLADGRANGDERAALADLAQVMRDASICGLGQTAANAVESAMINLGVLSS
jgi:NADH-quinone oxidoreductase subunit F